MKDITFQKLKNKKDADGYGEDSWGVWLESLVSKESLHVTQDEMIGRNTTKFLGPLWMKNAARNLPHVIRGGKSIKDLVGTEKDRPAIIVGAGPSVYNHKHLDLLKKSGFKGVIVATDRMLVPLLKKKIVPDYVLSIDGHAKLIPQFYEHPLVKESASQIKAALGLYVSPNLTRLLNRVGMAIYWFSPSANKTVIMMTASKKNPNGLLAIQTGGNTGTTSWVFSWVILEANPTCLIGFDFGYPEGTNLEKTYYYTGALNELPDDKTACALYVAPFYQEMYHPIFKTKAIIDPVFTKYRYVFLTKIKNDLPENIRVYNATEGGTLWGDKVECIQFRDFLSLVA